MFQYYPPFSEISIRAPLAGSDDIFWADISHPIHFNPRSPCGERRLKPEPSSSLPVFQSALPLRGATCHTRSTPLSLWDFNPRSPCGERLYSWGASASTFLFQSALPLRGATPWMMIPAFALSAISIRAPLAGSDNARTSCTSSCRYFNPRSPCGERRVHAPQEQRYRCDFNPRSPCGERLPHQIDTFVPMGFQSALPLRGATCETCTCAPRQRLISIRAPLAGSDDSCWTPTPASHDFNPRSPCGERPQTTEDRRQ